MGIKLCALPPLDKAIVFPLKSREDLASISLNTVGDRDKLICPDAAIERLDGGKGEGYGLHLCLHEVGWNDLQCFLILMGRQGSGF